MSPVILLGELLDSFAAVKGGKILVSRHDLEQWPKAAADAMKKQRLLIKVSPATSAICDGCEEHCCLPVHTITSDTTGKQMFFVICEERDDTNRVIIAPLKLDRWKCSIGAVCNMVADSLGLRSLDWLADDKGFWKIGIVSGDKRCQMAGVLADADGLYLQVASSKVPLRDLLVFENGRYTISVKVVRQLVDSSTTADERYTPSTVKRENRKLETTKMYEKWNKEYRILLKKQPGMSQSWYANKIAKLPIADGRDSETIRKHLKQ